MCILTDTCTISILADNTFSILNKLKKINAVYKLKFLKYPFHHPSMKEKTLKLVNVRSFVNKILK